MQMWQVIISLICGLLAVLALFISYRQSKRRGFIFHNKWLWATKEQREKMDEETKNAAYLLSRNAFFLISIMFMLLTVFILTLVDWVLYIVFILMAIAPIYAVVQSVKNGDFK